MDASADKINEFPDGSAVLVWYPPVGVEDRDTSAWAWLPGSVVQQCGSDEWRVVVEVPTLAVPDPSVPNGDAPENLLYPACFRDASELRAVTEQQWWQMYETYCLPSEEGSSDLACESL